MSSSYAEDSKKYIRTSLLFEHIIDDPIWMPYLLEFLSKHKQTQLLFFWLEVELFERIAGGGPDLVSQAKRLFDTYLAEDAPQRIELPVVTLDFIKAELAVGVPNINMFTAAQAFVFKTLQGVWYPSFLLSGTYQSLLDHLRKAFATPLREVLFDEVQSRYLEAFLLSGMSRQPPSAVGNIYLYKKIHYDIKPLGARLIRDKSGDRATEDLRLLLSDASSAYHNFLFTQQPTPSDPKAGPPKANATAIPLEARRRIADCLNRLIAQSNYYSSMGSRLPRDNSLISELVGLFNDVQRAIHTWLEVEVYPDFRKSWFCGILSGDAQSKLSAPVRRKRRLRNLFKSVRTFRHAYVAPCQRSEGQGLVLVSTENVSPPLPSLALEFVWSFSVGVEEIGRGGGLGGTPSSLSPSKRSPASAGRTPLSEEEDDYLQQHGDHGSVWGAIVSQKAGQGQGSVGARQGTRRFRSSIRSSQVMATELVAPGDEEREGKSSSRRRRRKASTSGGAEPDAEESALCSALESYLGRCVQRYALPSLCLLPLEHSTFVLFSPKLVVPEPSIHHFCVAVPRSTLVALTSLISPRQDGGGHGGGGDGRDDEDLEPSPLALITPRKQQGGGGGSWQQQQQQHLSPRSPVVDPQSGSALEPPDLSEEAVYLYGACLLEWDPDDEALLPRCLTLVSTQPRLDSLRSSLVVLREAQIQQQQAAGGDSKQQQEPLPPLLTNTRPPSKYNSSSSGKAGPPAAAGVVLTPHPSLDQPTLDGPLLPLFQALSPDTFSRVLSALLLERPLILRSATHSLAMVCAEGLRSLLYPFSWLHPYQPLLPVSSVCSFWEAIKLQANRRRSWNDYYFEDDALDDSLSPAGAGGDEYYPSSQQQPTSHSVAGGGGGHPLSTTMSLQQQQQQDQATSPAMSAAPPTTGGGGGGGGTTPGAALASSYFPAFLVGMDAAVIDAALATPPKGAAALSPAYRSAGGGGDRQPCRAWACDECSIHSEWGGQAPLSTGNSPFGPPTTSATPVSRSMKGAAANNNNALSSVPGTVAAARRLSVVKHGELPSCVRTSVREMVGEALVVDLDRDTIEEGGTEPSLAALPALPDDAAKALFRELRRCAYPQLEDFGHRQACTARAKKQQHRQSNNNNSHKEEETVQQDDVMNSPHSLGAVASGGEEGKAARAATEDPSVENGPIHEAFLSFYTTILLARYREFTLSYLDDAMVCFFADAFLAWQPQRSHPFWDQFLRTRMFAHFLYLEHQRLAVTAQEPPPPPTPRVMSSPALSSLPTSSSTTTPSTATK